MVNQTSTPGLGAVLAAVTAALASPSSTVTRLEVRRLAEEIGDADPTTAAVRTVAVLVATVHYVAAETDRDPVALWRTVCERIAVAGVRDG